METLIALKTGNGIQEMTIHYTNKYEGQLTFKEEEIEQAKEAFYKEDKCLNSSYLSKNDVDYSLDTVNDSDLIKTELMRLYIDEDGDVDDIETILISDNYIID